MLQFYAIVPADLHIDHQADLAQLLLEINSRIPIGAFTLAQAKQLIFRYGYSVSRYQAIDHAEFLETFDLFTFFMDTYSPLIEAVGSGDRPLEAALDDLAAASA